MHDYTIIVEQGEDGYLIASVIGLPGCYTQAKTYDQLLGRIKEAITLYVSDSEEENTTHTRFIGMQQVSV
ncbi:type II toxin-antitoxin system HicB family antitoxin [Candidatus Peregrinibacteria bacterium]|jgi:predicted RNase H-like HicB family nuclease|nr:type II toxin-antitoxin system HicB family antitoxin [Candidatus Peregrinibacteria bacterium]